MARSEVLAFADQIIRLGVRPGFLAGVSDEEAHHRVELLLGLADDPVSAVQVAMEIYGKDGIGVFNAARQREAGRAWSRRRPPDPA